MDRVPTDGPEIDLCRHCLMSWFDAGEFEQMPSRAAADIAAEKWQEELRRMQARRDESEFYAQLIRRPYMRF